eukprot:3304957-Ditylum_brightwellii.AAC.1
MSLTNNYAKGYGEDFFMYMKEHHNGELLWYVQRTLGSRQGIITEGGLPVYWNRQYYIEFLYERLQFSDKKNSIILCNMFTILSSLDMLAAFCLCAILHISIVIPFHWFAGNSHMLAKYN